MELKVFAVIIMAVIAILLLCAAFAKETERNILAMMP